MMLKENDLLNQRYRILRVLSDKGGMGLVYQAHDRNLNGMVVVKSLRIGHGWHENPEIGEAFEREAKLLFNMRHSSLPHVLDYFRESDGSQYFVMEYIPGKDLEELLRERKQQNEGPFPLELVIEWTEQILDALNYLHTNFDPPIIHRDIKPANLKLMPNGQIILLDFGIAEGAVQGLPDVNLWAYTKNYAPVEQMKNEGSSVRSDLYSLAITLYQLLTNDLPPDASVRTSIVIEGIADPLKPIHKINSLIPLAVSEVLQKAAALNQNDRYPSARAMKQAFSYSLTGDNPTLKHEKDNAISTVDEVETVSPRVLISYSHDSQAHKDRVLLLAERLRAEGIDCHLDQYELAPPEGWVRWMDNQFKIADYILVIATEAYCRRFEGREEKGKGLGAKWEGGIITSELYRDEATNKRFIPLIFSSEDIGHIPARLRDYTFYVIENDSGYEELYRRLTNQPRVIKRPLGMLRTLVPINR